MATARRAHRPAAAAPRLEDLAAHSDRPNRLKIGYQITADRFQGQVEFAYRTDWTQVLTTILWGGRIDDVSRRLLTDALRMTADEGHPVRIHAFAAAARDLLRHTAQTLAARHKARIRRGCYTPPARHGLPDSFIPAAGPLHDEFLAVARNLRNAARLRPGATVVEGPEANDSLQEALSALRGLSDSLGDYLQQVLQPLSPRVDHHAIHVFILETRREVNELAACCAVGEAYVEDLTITESDDRSMSIEIEGSLGAAGQ